MITATELCRKNLYNRLGVDAVERRDLDKMSAEILKMKRQLKHIIALAEPRLVMGGIRYGSDWKHDPLMDYIQKKFDLYRETGNAELLIDIINLAVVETDLKTHPEFHFRAEDRKGD